MVKSDDLEMPPRWGETMSRLSDDGGIERGRQL